jgi:hypothetical protein
MPNRHCPWENFARSSLRDGHPFPNGLQGRQDRATAAFLGKAAFLKARRGSFENKRSPMTATFPENDSGSVFVAADPRDRGQRHIERAVWEWSGTPPHAKPRFSRNTPIAFLQFISIDQEQGRLPRPGMVRLGSGTLPRVMRLRVWYSTVRIIKRGEVGHNRTHAVRRANRPLFVVGGGKQRWPYVRVIQRTRVVTRVDGVGAILAEAHLEVIARERDHETRPPTASMPPTCPMRRRTGPPTRYLTATPVMPFAMRTAPSRSFAVAVSEARRSRRPAPRCAADP